MREVINLSPRWGNPVRRIIIHAIAILTAMFFLALLATTTTFAAGAITWSGNTLSYEGNAYTAKTADGTTPPGLANNQAYYLFRESPNSNGTGKSHIIYFDSGTTMSTTTSANYAVYNLDSNGNYGSRISGPTDTTVTPKSQGASSTQAAWSGDAIQFDGLTYTGSAGAPNIANGTTAPILPSGTQYYQNRGSPSGNGTGTLSVIYFPASTNIANATTATFTTFKIDGGGNVTSINNSSTKRIDLVAQTTNPDASTAGSQVSSCGVEGIGWIVCPVSTFLAKGMDLIFDMLKGFLAVEPLSTDTNSPLFQAWNLIRSIANVAFVIVFLIIIYSQITSLGLSSYGIKKLLPRLIVAAILVNLSYYICAIAVDLSNITGASLQQILLDLRGDLDGPNTNSIASWESVTGFVLSNVAITGASAAALGGVIIASGGSLGAALILLLPMLLGLILAVLVALIVLAARQALIVILIILAPLAFVANLLPNTEKLFDKWRSIFMTMLVFYPLFALIFGGSQLAAFLIIQTASDINVILLAMFVQVAPLVLTPLLVKFSGGIVGRVAGYVNDPSKGFIDRTRNWAKGQSEYMAARNMARQDPVRQRQVLRRFAISADQNRRAREERMGAYKEASDARWTSTQQYSDIQQQLRLAQDEKSEGVDRAGLRYEISKTVNGDVRDVDLRLRDVKLRVDNAKALGEVEWEDNHTATIVEQRLESRVLKDRVTTIHSTHDAEYEEFKNGRFGTLPGNAAVGAMMHQAQVDSRLLALNAMRNESAKRAISEQFTSDLESNVRFDGQLMQTYAGGVQGIAGAQRALAAAISAQAGAHNDAVKNAATILSHGNYDDSVITEIALGRSAGTTVVVTDDMREAAIAKIAGGANTVEIMKLMENIEINTTAANQDFRQTFAETLLTNSNKPKFAGAGILASMKQGIAPPAGPGRINQYISDTINANKLGSADVLVNTDRDYLNAILNTIKTNRASLSPQALATMKASLQMARSNPLYAGKIAERKEVLDDIEGRL